MEIWQTFFNRRNSAEVFGESKACWELLEWNVDGLYILTTREHNYFVNILFLYMLFQLLLTMTYFLSLVSASKLKPRMWMSRNPACDPVHGGVANVLNIWICIFFFIFRDFMFAFIKYLEHIDRSCQLYCHNQYQSYKSDNYFPFNSMHRGSQNFRKLIKLHFLLAHLYEMIIFNGIWAIRPL